MLDKMKEHSQTYFLIDGFPKNQDNLTEWNKKMGDKVDLQCVLFFDCDEQVCRLTHLVQYLVLYTRVLSASRFFQNAVWCSVSYPRATMNFILFFLLDGNLRNPCQTSALNNKQSLWKTFARIDPVHSQHTSCFTTNLTQHFRRCTVALIFRKLSRWR